MTEPKAKKSVPAKAKKDSGEKAVAKPAAAEEAKKKRIPKDPAEAKAKRPAKKPVAAEAPSAPAEPAVEKPKAPKKIKADPVVKIEKPAAPAAAPAPKPVAKPVVPAPAPVASPRPAPAPARPAPSAPKPVTTPPKPVVPAVPVPVAAVPAQAPVTAAPVAPVAPPSAPKPAAAPVAPAAPPAPRKKIQVNEMITVKELAAKMSVGVPDLIKKLMGLGVLANMNQRIPTDTAQLVADAFSFDVEVVSLYAQESLESADEAAQLKPRPPVVTIMGHVDHGKTSLLDAIREARVAEKEAGGITQHIGAYQTRTEKGIVTFLDTPGHAAFTAMRARGAQATDLVVLVVAADDGVMPQTIEALDHARAAGVPIIVALNKCDLPTANPQKVKQELANHNLLAEDWGGKTQVVEVSARTKANLDALLDSILLEAEILELKANPDRPAQGVVVEARLDARRGAVATVLIQKGTLRVGDSFVCGLMSGKVRAMTDHRGHRVHEAPPAFPVEILGLSKAPQTGDRLIVAPSDREAREIADRRQVIAAGDARSPRRHLTLEAFHQEAKIGKVKGLSLILKADVQGSLEAVRDSLEKLSNTELNVKVIHAGVGGVNGSDVVLADASDAVILGFNVRPDPASEEAARRQGVEIKTYRIIYELINDVKAALEGMLDPEEIEVTKGWAEVRQVFRTPKAGAVAGCFVTDGKASRACKVRLLRDGAIIFDGALGGLRRFKDDVREVDKGFECGISIAGFQDVKPGDRIELYLVEKRARKL